MDANHSFVPRLLRSPADFEEAAADWMRVWGCRSVKRTRTGPDGGIDVESVEAVAQVKAWMVPVGSPEIQQLKGAAYDGRLAVFFSLTDYTPSAKRFANQAGVALFRFSGYNGEVEPINGYAREFLEKQRGLERRVRPPVENVLELPLCKLVEQSLNQLVSNPGFFVLSVKQAPNRYVQASLTYNDVFVVKSADDRHGKPAFVPSHFDSGDFIVESVGDAHADPALEPSEITRLEELGWRIDPNIGSLERLNEIKRIVEELGCRIEPNVGNYQIEYLARLTPQKIEEIAALLARTLIEVHGAENPDDIEITIDS